MYFEERIRTHHDNFTNTAVMGKNNKFMLNHNEMSHALLSLIKATVITYCG